MREATAQQKLFIDEYLRGRKSNATEAAKAAGYSIKSAHVQAYQLLKNPIVLRYLKEKEEAIDKELRQEFLFDAIEARRIMLNIMKDEEAANRDRLSAAKDFLDRAGFKPTDKQEIDINLNKSLEDFFGAD